MSTNTASPPRQPRRRVIAGVSALVVAASAATVVQVQAAQSPDGAAPASPAVVADAPNTATVDWLLGQMTPAEQLNLIEGSHSNKNNADNTLDPDTHNQAGYVRGIPRLGVPQVRHADALGIEAFAAATAYPNRLGLASSFDRQAFSEFGQRVGEDGKEMGMDLIYGPQVDLARTPSWTRNMTAYSEDPFVASELAEREINGIQSTGLMSQVKHVSFYSGQNQSVPSLVGSQAANELYLAPAEAALKAGVTSMMCSYATFQILGEESKPDYACSNQGLLRDIVKGRWNFKGWITTDYGGGKATSDLLAGTDQEFSTKNFSEAKLLPLLDPTSTSYDGRYAAAADESTARILYQYERFGLLDNSKIPARFRSPVPQHGDVTDTDNTISIDKGAGIRTSRALAEKSAVLLKNDDATLPLKDDRSVAVIGQSSTLLPAGPGGERALGFGDRVNITPVKAMTSIAGDRVTSVPGIDLLGQTVPSTALSTDDQGATRGLTRTATAPDGQTTTTTDQSLDGNQVDLQKGTSYTWTGYIDAPSAGSYRLLTQRPYGTDLGGDAKYNQSTRPASNSTTSVSLDGRPVTLTNPDSKVLQNGYPSFATNPSIQKTAANGQYLGYENVGAVADLTAGRHQITVTYAPKATAATTPTFRLAWSPVEPSVRQAEEAARTHDASVVFVDDANQVTGDGVSPQTDVAQLSADQNALVTRVADAAHAAGHEVTVVVNSNAAVQMPWADQVDAILEMWYPGQEGGTATAETLYGRSNPTGKLPLTFPRNSAETLFAGHPERGAGTQEAGEPTPTIKWTEGLDIGYRWYASEENRNRFKPLFAFGHGLSYTEYRYDGLTAKPAEDGGVDLSFAVQNTGGRSGSEIPQVYVGPSSKLDGSIAQSAVKLVQFDRVALAPGETKTVSMHVAPRELSSWSEADRKWVLGAGSREVSVGAASDDIRLRSTVDVGATTPSEPPAPPTETTPSEPPAPGTPPTQVPAPTKRPTPTLGRARVALTKTGRKLSVRIRPSVAVRATVTLQRRTATGRYVLVARVRRSLAPGARTLTVTLRRRLAPGVYRVAVSAASPMGDPAKRQTVRFRVRH